MLNANVGRAGHTTQLCSNVLREGEIRVQVCPRDLDVDRGRKAEIQDLVHDVRRLKEEGELGEPLGQRGSKRAHVSKCRAVGGCELHEHVRVGRTHCARPLDQVQSVCSRANRGQNQRDLVRWD